MVDVADDAVGGNVDLMDVSHESDQSPIPDANMLCNGIEDV